MIRVGVLAGGEGRRMGGDKPLKVIGKKPMVYWVVKTLRCISLPVYISVKTSHQAEKIKTELVNSGVKGEEFVFVFDRYPEIPGPISGIVSLLSREDGQGCFLISAVDQPLLDLRFLNYLSVLSNIFCHRFVIVTKTKEKIHPFPGIYPTYLKDLVEHFLKTCKKRSLYRLFMELKSIGAVFFLNESNPNMSNTSLLNINTPETLRMVEDVFTRA